MKLSEIGSQECSIARALAAVGDGWMLAILRDAFLGRRRFSEFEEGTGAQPTVISDRLKRMVELGGDLSGEDEGASNAPIGTGEPVDLQLVGKLILVAGHQRKTMLHRPTPDVGGEG